MIDSSRGSFEAGMGDLGQTREHVLLLKSLGVEELIVAINKLETLQWAQDRYNLIKEQVLELLESKGFKKSLSRPLSLSLHSLSTLLTFDERGEQRLPFSLFRGFRERIYSRKRSLSCRGSRDPPS